MTRPVRLSDDGGLERARSNVVDEHALAIEHADRSAEADEEARVRDRSATCRSRARR